MTLALGDTAPDFHAQTTEGSIDFHGVDWGLLGGPVLASEGLHPGMHDRAWLPGQDQARVRPAGCEDHRPVG